MPHIGGHVSVAGGLHTGIENAERIGARAIQFFGASPRMWYAKQPSEQEVALYKEKAKASSVARAYLHAPYLVNLASPDGEMLKKSVKNLSDHLRIAHLVGANGLIFHVGSGKEMPKAEAMERAIEAMSFVLESVPGDVELVIENAAGGGQKLGASAHEIGEMLERIDSPRLKVCFDTAHAFEAGIIESYTPEHIKKLFDEWDREVGMQNIVALHVNDSKTAYNSHHDRHENIGEGHIGLLGFQSLARESRLHDKAWILEVPGFDGMGPDKKNIEILTQCFKQ
jgi:deoxyribonuclease-4